MAATRAFEVVGNLGWIDPVNLAACSFLWLIFYGLQWSVINQKITYYIGAVMFAAAIVSVSGSHYKPIHGLTANYYANSEFLPPIEASWRYKDQPYTRIDPDIDFSAVGFSWSKNNFPLAFANDVRHNVYQPGQTQAEFGYIFSAEWRGSITFPKEGASLKLLAAGGVCEFHIDGVAILCNSESESYAGTHSIDIRYVHNNDKSPSISLKWKSENRTVAVPASALTPINEVITSKTFSRNLAIISLLVWSFALLVLLMLERPLLKFNARVAFWTLFIFLVIYNAKRLAEDGIDFGSLVIAPGNDMLLYETMARDILFGDWLTRIETPFVYMNFAYRYLLAAMHYLVGEMPAQVVWLQQVIMSGVITLAISLAFKQYNLRTAIVMGLLIMFGHLYAYADLLLDTVFGVAFGYACIVSILRYTITARRRWLLLAALSLGIGILVRANFLPFVAVCALWLLWPRVNNKFAIRLMDVAIFVGICTSFIALLGLRNYYVSGQWMFMPATGLVNLWVGNHPAKFDGLTYHSAIVPPKDQILPLLWDYVRNDPFSVLHHAAVKLLYLIGIDLRTGIAIKASSLFTWLIACVGSALLWRRKSLRQELILWWTFIAAVNLPLVVIFPWGYGMRLSAPSFLPLYLIAAISIDQMLGFWFKKSASRNAYIANT